MMTTDSTIATTRLQRHARRLLLGTCCLLLMGIMGAAADTTAKHKDRPAEQIAVEADAGFPVDQVMLAAAATTDVQPAEAELLDKLVARTARHDHREAPTAAKPRTMMMEVTAYCPCTICCGPQAQGLTASGKHVSYNNGQFVAADTNVLPFGTKLIIPGYAGGKPVEVIDRGGAIKGNKLDVYFDDHQVALQWGRQWIEVTIAE